MSTKRRKLSDLYVRGRELAPNDGAGDPIKIWLNKLNEVDRESCIRRANAAKARYVMEADDEDSEAFAAMYAEARDVRTRDELISFLVVDDLQAAKRRHEAEIGADEESWGKEDHLQGLVDAWIGDDENPGLSQTIVEDPDDPEANRVSAELDRFEAEVRAEVEAERQRLVKDYEDVDLEALRRQVAHKLVELKASEEFIREYRRQQVFYSVREPNDHRKRHFSTVADVDDLDDELRTYLIEQYETLLVPPDEGKDSPPEGSSSNSSVAPAAEEAAPSGHEDANPSKTSKST